MPLESPPEAEAINSIIPRLRNPSQRILYELFWFWSSIREADEALAQHRLDAACEAWTGLECDDDLGGVATHNLAVMWHATALDFEHKATERSLEQYEIDVRDKAWQEGLRRWILLLKHDEFWHRFAARVTGINDPRLKADSSEHIRAALPVALVTICIRLAVSAAERRKPKTEIERHRDNLRSVGFAPAIIAEAEELTLRPLKERIQHYARANGEEAGRHPHNALTTCTNLLDTVEPMLAILNTVLPDESKMSGVAHDEVAMQVHGGLVGYIKETEDWRGCESSLRRALALARKQATRQRLARTKDLVNSYIESGNYWYCEDYRNLTVDVKARLDEARRFLHSGKTTEAISLLEAMLYRPIPSPPGKIETQIRRALAICLKEAALAKLRNTDRYVGWAVLQAFSEANWKLCYAEALCPANKTLQAVRSQVVSQGLQAGMIVRAPEPRTRRLRVDGGYLNSKYREASCWFCGSNQEGDRARPVLVALHKVASRIWSFGCSTVEVYWHGQFAVPRCQGCTDIQRRGGEMVSWRKRQVRRILGLSPKRKPASAAYDYPPLAELLRTGWSLGREPKRTACKS